MEEKITLNNTYMNVIKFGSGSKNLAVIAGISLCGLEGLGDQIENALKEFSSDFTVYVFDRIKTIPKGYTIENMAEDIYNCLSKLGIDRTFVYGTSQGGMIGMVLAMNHPEIVEKLVLCSTAAKNAKDNKAFLQWKSASQSGNVESLNKLFLEYVYSHAFKESIKDYIPTLIKQGTQEDLKRFAILVESMEDFDITEQLNKIRCPILAICDKNDKVFDYGRTMEIAEITGCQTLVYEQYSHAVYDEAPDLKSKILQFCRS